MAKENKMRPTDVRVEDFLASVSEQRRGEAEKIIAMMQSISGHKPVMWGPRIIGFGLQHYKSEAGREGDMGLLGFSPRKAAITIYFYEGFDRYGAELARLGKHKISQGCLYINKLSDIDMTVLRAMLTSSFKFATSKDAGSAVKSVDSYLAAIPAAARGKFDELRALVRSELPNANEVISYGIVGYKIDHKRARVFISGWKDHIAVYPVPKDELLRQELAPYVKGKGTLWFPLDAPLPKVLLQKVVRALVK